MEFLSILVILFSTSQLSFGVIGSTLNEAKDLSIEDTVIHLKRKITEMEEMASKREEEITKRVSEAEMRCEKLTSDISARLQNAEVRFLSMDTHLLVELQQSQEKSSEALDRVQIAEQEVVSMLESKTDILQVKMNETRELLNSFIASHRYIENVIRKNISSSTEKLMHLNNSLSSRFESLTMKMRIFQNSLSGIEKDYANISFVSKMDQSLKNLDKTLKTDIDSIQSGLSPRVKRLEERCALREDVAELNKTLRNHTAQISALNTDLLDNQTSCHGEPPTLPNEETTDLERKHGSKVRYECDENYALTSHSTVHCDRGNWVVQPPVCSFFDSTFYLQTWTDENFIYCRSVGNYYKIEFAQVLDTGLDANFLDSTAKSVQPGYVVMNLGGLDSSKKYGFFQCGFSDERGSMKTVVHRQDVNGDLYFVDHSKVANIGDTIDLEVKFDMVKSIRWRHNGVDVPSWNNKGRVEIPRVQPSDAGTFECYYEGQRGLTASAFLRLIVRKCQKNLFGEHCDQLCPPCYNGGICHDYLGLCVCPPGFNGTNCEVDHCEEDRYGVDCSENCRNECEKYLFCLPDPYGCSCGRGWKGLKCDEPCEPGWYGTDCKQPCHCADGPHNCNRWKDTCSGGCSSGWTGQSCQIKVVD